MGYYSDDWKSKIDPDAVYATHDGKVEEVSPYRDYLYSQFTRQISSLLESKKPRVENTTRGLLNTRRLYRYKFDDQVFQKKTHTPSSNTTFLFLLDNSGSMSESFYPNMGGEGDACKSITCLDASNAVVSAFCKAVKTVLNNEIKVEVFYKSTPQNPFNGFIKGYTPMLTRVFSNTKNDMDWDKILKVDTHAPVTLCDPDGEKSRPSGSYTPEFLLLPALVQWMRKNITTKNVCIINMTDGSVQHTFVKMDESGESYRGRSFNAQDEDTGTLRIKYLRGIPHTTLFLGASSWMRDTLERVYGERNSKFVENESFVQDFFKLLNQMVDEYVK